MQSTQLIVPTLWFDNNALNSGDPKRATRVTQAMLKMIKLDSAELQRAYDESS